MSILVLMKPMMLKVAVAKTNFKRSMSKVRTFQAVINSNVAKIALRRSLKMNNPTTTISNGEKSTFSKRPKRLNLRFFSPC